MSSSGRGADDGHTNRDVSARAKVASVNWYHRFEILPGLITPGTVDFDACHLLDSIGIERDLRGKRALDIGTWDGPMAFELERRGANVTALDVLEPQESAFSIARELVGSKVEYIQGSVYDLSKIFVDRFDLICFLGVYYHLRDPVTAFEEISKMLSDDGRVFVEGECLRNYAEDIHGGKGWTAVIKDLADSPLPIALFPPAEYKGSPNWIIPNFSCLLSWFKVTKLEPVTHFFEEVADSKLPHQRVKVLARKQSDSLRITGVTRAGRRVIVRGNGFSERSVVNFFCSSSGTIVNLGGLMPHGAARLPVSLKGPDELEFVMPSEADRGRATIEICNPPYLDSDRASWAIEIS
jgi:tRNA (mo5U34)-methyltransferase